MNRLDRSERMHILRVLVEGNSMRATARITGHSINTVTALLLDVGNGAAFFQDAALRDLASTRIECDEIRTFVHARQKNLPPNLKGKSGYGDTWIWVALDPDTKLVCSWLVGRRDVVDARVFLEDLKARLMGRIQLTTDGHLAYVRAVEDVFGGDIDYAVSMKNFAWAQIGGRSEIIRSETMVVVTGNPAVETISTSGIERQNLTMRTSMRRLTRFTNGISRSVLHLRAALALHYVHYNYGRPHKSLANPYPRTPAMAAGLADHIWTWDEILDLGLHQDLGALQVTV